VLLDFKKPFDLIPYYKRSYDEKLLAQKDFKNSSLSSKISPSNIWSHLLNAVRTYYENEITKT
jgi:hypothetical protein